MSVSWVDIKPGDDRRSKITLSRHISSYLEPIDPSPAIETTLRLVHLLLLSNHINKAHELITALYKFAKDIVPKNERNPRDPLHPSLILEAFWLTHEGMLARPANANQFQSICLRRSISRETYLAQEQWGKYREANRTGWMLEHCQLTEPGDPHIWRETDDPVMLAMCARLLSKTLEKGTYPSIDTMREALAAGQKLYAQPQDPMAWDYKGRTTPKKHSFLLYRRLVCELAIRVGELPAAANIISQGLQIDGFVTGGSLHDYLLVPGIYDVLPLLAQGGKERNPFFITEEAAEIIVSQIIATLELRAREGRQWSLAEGKVGWEELLNRLAEGAWKVNKKEYRRMGVRRASDILYLAATEKKIKDAEDIVGELPSDFKEMIRVANGFKGGCHLFGGGIAGIQEIRITQEDLENYVPSFEELKQDSPISGLMIELEPGVECDSFYHYIIPHKMWKDNLADRRELKDGEYRYWHWAPWQASLKICDSVRDWVASCVEEVEGMVHRGETMDSDESDSEDEDDGSSEEDSQVDKTPEEEDGE